MAPAEHPGGGTSSEGRRQVAPRHPSEASRLALAVSLIAIAGLSVVLGVPLAVL